MLPALPCRTGSVRLQRQDEPRRQQELKRGGVVALELLVLLPMLVVVLCHSVRVGEPSATAVSMASCLSVYLVLRLATDSACSDR